MRSKSAVPGVIYARNRRPIRTKDLVWRIHAESDDSQPSVREIVNSEIGSQDGLPDVRSNIAPIDDNGSPSLPSESSIEPDALSPDLTYVEPTRSEKAVTKFKLSFALPWRRFKQGSVLSFTLSGAIAEQPQPRFSSVTALPSVCDSLIKASYDPRVVGLVIKIDPLSLGWGKILEIRRHVEFFKKSGKFTIAYMERAGEKEVCGV